MSQSAREEEGPGKMHGWTLPHASSFRGGSVLASSYGKQRGAGLGSTLGQLGPTGVWADLQMGFVGPTALYLGSAMATKKVSQLQINQCALASFCAELESPRSIFLLFFHSWQLQHWQMFPQNSKRTCLSARSHCLSPNIFRWQVEVRQLCLTSVSFPSFGVADLAFLNIVNVHNMSSVSEISRDQ